MTNNSTRRIAIAGGGTGGHVFPALALGDALRAAGCELLFVGSAGGLEERLVPARGYRLACLRVGKLKGSAALARARTLLGLPLAVGQAFGLLREFRADAVVGAGGFASGPTVLAAAALRLPTVLLEQNSIPGVTNRVLSRFAERVVTAYACSEAFFPRGRTLRLGNPLRPELLSALRGRTRLPGEFDGAPCLLVLGGSQGAHALNEIMTAVAQRLHQKVPGLRIIHQTGRTDRETVAGAYRAAGIQAEVHAFIDDMATVLLRADLVLGRAGATTAAELAAFGIPAVLVPYPYAADDHQAKNAEELAASGGARMMRQEALTPDLLLDELAGLLSHPAELQRMGKAMAALGRPDAAQKAAEVVLELARQGSCEL